VHIEIEDEDEKGLNCGRVFVDLKPNENKWIHLKSNLARKVIDNVGVIKGVQHLHFNNTEINEYGDIPNITNRDIIKAFVKIGVYI
jgi:hypothetical protein